MFRLVQVASASAEQAPTTVGLDNLRDLHHQRRS